MEKKQIMPLEEDFHYESGLTRINPDTKFVIRKKTGQILYIFKKEVMNDLIQFMIDSGKIKSVDQLRKNAYDDLLVIT